MALNRRGPATSKRIILGFLLFCFVLIAGLTGWNLTSAPQLRPASQTGADPIDYRTSFNLEENPSGKLPAGAMQAPVTAAPVQPTRASLAAQSGSVGPGVPTPTPIRVAAKTPGTVFPVVTPDPAAPNLLQSYLPTPAPATSKPQQNLRSLQLGPNVSYNNSLSSLDITGPAVGRIQARGAEFIDASGARYFMAGVNYEGHTDRAWLMWQNDRWDPGLIAENMAVAAAGGYNCVRIFVQTQLRDDIKANNFSKLDKVVEIARQNNLRLLVTFADYYEPDISKLTEIDTAVARHYAANPTIVGYDLRNEPQFEELIGLIYPPGQEPPLQKEDIIRVYGERINQADSDNWRRGAGSKLVPGYLNSRQAYVFANILRIYDEFQNDTGHWVNRNGRATPLDFFNSPDAARWAAFIDALNGTVQRYIELRQGAIHLADPGRLTTIGWNRPDLIRMPANRSLGFISLHRFPGDSANGLAGTLAMLDYLKNFFGGKPVVLEEFGYSNSDGRTKIPPLKTASYETAIWLFLYGRGYAGGYKWMLNNFTIGANPYENNFGLLDDNSLPKPAYHSARAVLRLAASNRTPSGDFGRLESYDGVTISYTWGSSNAFFGNGQDFKDNRIQLSQLEAAPWAIWWPNNGLGEVFLSTTAAAQVQIDLRAIFPSWKAGMRPVMSLDTGQPPNFDLRSDALMAFTAVPGTLYSIKAPVQPAAFNRANPLNVVSNLYFKETGHNLSNVFKRYWESRGGLAVYGFPISEEFQENGFTVQYFERARFEYHPEHSGTANEVQLGLLGNLISSGRREAGESPFQHVAPFNNAATEVFFSQTGHSLKGGFKAYWEANGGLSQFGYPISEEFQEVNPADGKVYTVQYFERNRFEWHPEFSKTPAEFQLGLLGLQVVKARGWLQ